MKKFCGRLRNVHDSQKRHGKIFLDTHVSYYRHVKALWNQGFIHFGVTATWKGDRTGTGSASYEGDEIGLAGSTCHGDPREPRDWAYFQREIRGSFELL